jgi:hypothetical protein
MARIVQANRRATNRQIKAQYRHLGTHNSSVLVTHPVPLLSAKNKKKQTQWARYQQHWTIEEWKSIAWSDKLQFLLRHADCRIRNWQKAVRVHHPSCLMSTLQAGGSGVMVWGTSSWHTLGPIEQRFHAPKNSGISGGRGVQPGTNKLKYMETLGNAPGHTRKCSRSY